MTAPGTRVDPMISLRLLLIGLLSTVSAFAAVQAAPAPVAKPARHVPSPETLLANLRAEGYHVVALNHGREPGTYAVTLALRIAGDDFETFAATVHRTYQVRTDSADVQADLRAFLKA